MRTTLTLDDDVLDKARSVAQKLGAPFRQVVNEALRAGLPSVEKPSQSHRYHTQPHRMGLKPGLSLDNIQELLSHMDNEGRR